MAERKFYKTIIQVTVLSEGPFEYDGLDDVHYAINEGDCVGSVKTLETTELTSQQAAEALYELGSTPDFFNLDEDPSIPVEDEGTTLDDASRALGEYLNHPPEDEE